MKIKKGILVPTSCGHEERNMIKPFCRGDRYAILENLAVLYPETDLRIYHRSALNAAKRINGN